MSLCLSIIQFIPLFCNENYIFFISIDSIILPVILNWCTLLEQLPNCAVYCLIYLFTFFTQTGHFVCTKHNNCFTVTLNFHIYFVVYTWQVSHALLSMKGLYVEDIETDKDRQDFPLFCLRLSICNLFGNGTTFWLVSLN